MAALGINVPGDARVSPEQIAATGATWCRFVLRFSFDLTSWLEGLKALGIGAVAVGDSYPDSLGDDEALWADRIGAALARYGGLVSAWQWGNESDHQSDSSWWMPKDRLNRLLKTAADAMPNERRWGPGLASGNPEWAVGVEWGYVHKIAIHPYAKAPGSADLDAMLDGYASLQKPLVATEFDSRTPGMAAFLRDDPRLDGAAIFCYDSLMVEEFGLFDAQGNPRASANDFLAATGGPLVALPMQGGDDVALLICQKADEYGVPRLAALTLALAESNLDPRAFNPKDLPYGSAGLFQRNLKYVVGSDFSTAAEARQWFDNPTHACDQALPVFAAFLAETNDDVVAACCLWNGLPADQNENRDYYANRYAKAQQLFPNIQEVDLATFKFGFKTLADTLGADVVGQPLEEETYFTFDDGRQYSFQMTSKGIMVYSKGANQPVFLPGRTL